jgi:hypothetical protein
MRDPVRTKLKKGGRPRRQRLSEDEIRTFVRPWIPSALTGQAPYYAAYHRGQKLELDPTAVTKRVLKEHLATLRGFADDLTIAEEAYKYLVAQAKQEHRRVEREAFIERIANWLKMDSAKLANFLRRSKRVR